MTTSTNKTYAETIQTLFDLLTLANAADSDDAQPWQHSDDAGQRNGFFGDVYKAICRIAGPEIVSHWVETGEVETSLANR